jgi:predicted  nucleic acid-binding Zn-ribbon protein
MNRDWIKDYKDYDLTKALNLQREKNTLFMDVSSLQSKASQQARDIAWEENNKTREAHVNAVNELNKMIDDKLATLPQYSEEKINTVKAIVSRLSPDSSYLAIDPSSDKIAAEAKAALYDDDGTMLKAYNIANDTGIKSVTYDTQGVGTIRSLASYKSDKTNVELAAEIQSTLDGTYTSDNINGYMAAKYGQGSIIEKIPRFTSKEEKEVNKELSKFFSENITSTSAVKKEIKSIKNEIKSVQSEKIDITKNIQGLNEEIEKINSSEQQIQKQIVELNSDLRQKEGLFKEKEKAITDNINEISAIEFQIEQLQSQKSEVESKINLKSSEIEGKLAEVTKTENEVKTISNELLSKQSEFDTQINQLQESRKPLLNVTTSLVNELRELNKEVDELEKAKPIYEKQIVELKDEIEKLNNTKADLATAQAQTIGLEVDEKTIKSIPKMEDTAIIALNGPALVRVVDDAMLVEQAEAFKAPISEFAVNAQIFTAAAVRPEELFAVKNITGEIKVALSDGTVKEIGSGSLGIKIEEAGVDPAQTASIDKSATMTDATTETISTAASMNVAKSQAAKAQSNLKSVSTASSTLSSVSAADMEISGGYSAKELENLAPGTPITYNFSNVATSKAVAATKTATTAASSSRAAATEAATAAEAAQESAQAAAVAAAQAQEAAQAAATEAAQAAAATASRQAAEAAAIQAAQAAAATQAQQAALAAATQATTAAANIAAQAAATNTAVAVQGAATVSSLTQAAVDAKLNQTEMTLKANALNAIAAQAGATQAQKDAATAAEAASQAAGNAKRAAEATAKATHTAVSLARRSAQAAAAQAAQEASAAAALAIQDSANEVAQAAAVAAAAAAQQAAISSIESRIAELQSALATLDTEEKIMKAAGHNTEWVDGVGTNIVNQGNVEILRGNIETWKNEIASEEQKLEEANK